MANKRTYQLDEETTVTDDMTLLIDDASFAETKRVKVSTLVAAIVAAGEYVPYTGATESVDLGSNDLKAGTASFGGATGYTSFGTNGSMKMIGDAMAFRDEKNDVLNLKSTGPGVSINATESTAEFTTGSNLSDYLYVNVQLNHDRRLSTNIYPHIHFFQATDKIPNFLLQYRWQINGSAKVTAWTSLICNTAAFTYVSGTMNQIALSEPISPPANDTRSDIVQFRVLRDNSNDSELFDGTDPVAATVGIMSFDVHIEVDSIGSDEEYLDS